MTDFANNKIKQRKVCKYILSNLFYLAIASAAGDARAQTATASDSIPQNKNKTGLSAGVDNISALTVEKDATVFYNNIQPYVEAHAENSHGYYADFAALVEITVLNDDPVTSTLSKFTAELGKKLNNGGELFIKVGREETQDADVSEHAIDYMAENDTEDFGNSVERLVFGFRDKNGNYFEAGTVWDTGTGKYIICPDKNTADFWGRGHLSILNKSNIGISLEAAARLGAHHRLGIASATLETAGGFGLKTMFERDFTNNENKELVRIYKNLKNGTAVIGELVHAGEGRGIDLRLGLGKKGLQIYAQYNTENKAPSAGISYTFGLKKDLRGKKSR